MQGKAGWTAPRGSSWLLIPRLNHSLFAPFEKSFDYDLESVVQISCNGKGISYYHSGNNSRFTSLPSFHWSLGVERGSLVPSETVDINEVPDLNAVFLIKVRCRAGPKPHRASDGFRFWTVHLPFRHSQTTFRSYCSPSYLPIIYHFPSKRATGRTSWP